MGIMFVQNMHANGPKHTFPSDQRDGQGFENMLMD